MRNHYSILIEMRNKKSQKKKGATSRIAEKYGMSGEKLRQHDRKVEETKHKYSMDAAEVDRALTEYCDIKDPIVVGGKAVMWCRRPTMKELKAMIPEEMRQYVDGGEVPEEINEKYEKFYYEKMADLIVVPKRTAEEWAEKCTPWITRLFWGHISDIGKVLENRVEGF